MFKFNSKRVKLYFIISIAVVAPLLFWGVMKLNGDYYWQKNFVKMQWFFVRTRVEYLIQNTAFFGTSDQNNLKAIEAGKGASAIPVLLYHGVIDDSNWTPDEVNISLENFRKQMMLLKSLGFETVSLHDFLSFQRGEKILPEKSFLLTFDDGRKDSYYTVDPILKALGYKATMFVITGRSLNKDINSSTFHLNGVELKKMVESGRWEIESHTQNGHDLEKIDASGNQGHFLSNKLWLKYEGRSETDEEYRKRVESDLAGSKSDIEKNLGISVEAFAYPFGDYGPGSVNVPESQNIIVPLVQKIFSHSFYQARESDFAGNYPGKSFRIKRLNIDSQISPDKLVAILLNAQDKTASEYKDDFFSDKGWMEGWGKRQFKNGLMLTGPKNSEDSSLTFLSGTYLWQDYSFRSQVQLERGRAFALMARYQDGKNYATCDFGENELSINEHRGGIEYTIAQIPFSSQIFSSQAEAGVVVKGQEISCLVNGKAVLASKLNSELSHGGIGFKTWDYKLFNSELLVKKVNVEGISLASRESFRGVIEKK